MVPLHSGPLFTLSLLPLLRAADIAATRDPLQLVQWADAAEHCKLSDLHAHCVARAAHLLAGLELNGCLDAHISGCLQLAECCSKGMMALLLALLAAAGQGLQTAGAGRLRLVDRVASPEGAAAALRRVADPTHGCLEWTLERFSEQPGGVGSRVDSPWIAAAGRDWVISVYPGGSCAQAAGHLSGEMGRDSRDVSRFSGRRKCLLCEMDLFTCPICACATQCTSSASKPAQSLAANSQWWTNQQKETLSWSACPYCSGPYCAAGTRLQAWPA